MAQEDPRGTRPDTDVTGREHRGESRLLAVRDVVDAQLESLDGWRIGRVADLRAEWQPDGSLIVREFVIGPEAHAGRVARWAARLATRVFKGRHEYGVPVGDAEELGPTVRLSRKRTDYLHTRLDDWLADHVIRWIPGGGP
jgi:hypothetical protein